MCKKSVNNVLHVKRQNLEYNHMDCPRAAPPPAQAEASCLMA
jgi:hypothetical protein